MKTILMIALSLASFAASAKDPKVFAGRYSVKTCPLYSFSENDYERGYIRTTKDEQNDVIELNLYGDEALFDEFVIGSNPRQVPGTEIGIHGDIQERTEVKWLGKTDIEVVKYVLKDKKEEKGSYSRLQLKGGTLTITSTWASSKLEKCVLIKSK